MLCCCAVSSTDTPSKGTEQVSMHDTLLEFHKELFPTRTGVRQPMLRLLIWFHEDCWCLLYVRREECENDDEWKVRRWQLHDKQFWRSSWKEITNVNCIYVFFRSALRGNHQALPCLLQVLLISRLILNYTAFRLAFFRVEV